MAERILILLATGFACAYGINQLRKGVKIKYFYVTFCGMAALFLARIYYLVILLSEGNDEIFTVGVLGQASAYLFFMTANISFLSHDILTKSKKKICLPGVIGAAIIGLLYIISAIKIGTAGAYIGELIYIFSMCGAFYFSANAISCRKEFMESAATWQFNLCVCILTCFNAVSELMNAVAPEQMITLMTWLLSIFTSVIILIMLPLLRKGIKKCPQ